MVLSPAKLMRVLTSLVDRSLDEREAAGGHDANNGQQTARQNGHHEQNGHDGATAARPERRRRMRGGHPHLAVVEREDSHGKPRSTPE